MKAYIRKDKWNDFKENYLDYWFLPPIDDIPFYVKTIEKNLKLIINKKTRELKLITPMGESPFMETQNQFYQDLINDDFIQYKSGKFD